jgi:hypothetical protein
MIPVRRARHDHALDVGQDVGQRLAARRRRRWQLRRDVARPHVRHDAVALGVREVLGDPVDQLRGVAAEVVDGEVAAELGGVKRLGHAGNVLRGCGLRTAEETTAPQPAVRSYARSSATSDPRPVARRAAARPHSAPTTFPVPLYAPAAHTPGRASVKTGRPSSV